MNQHHVGLSFGRVEHWHDGLGEFSRQLGTELALRAAALRRDHGIHLHFHLPQRWHGQFGRDVHYRPLHTLQRFWHWSSVRFALWHRLHQHIRLLPPSGTPMRVETVHDLNFLHLKVGSKRERYRQRMVRRLRGSAAVVAITQHVADDLTRQLPRLGIPVTVIHNGVTDLTRARSRAVKGVGDRPFLLHLSRMAPSKNIEAILTMAAAWPSKPIVLAGATSSYTSDVQRMVAERKLGNVTVRLDLDEAEKAWLYAHCEGFVFPSLAEGFGLPPIEAMHFGKPVFLSRLTSLPEVGGDVANYFDSFDAAAMRAVVEKGLAGHQQTGRAEALVQRARHFSWARCAEAYLALYIRLLRGVANDPMSDPA
jgi:glycosyltransferase involved in cell wall biosynthesis